MVLLSYLVMCLIFGTTFLAIKIGLEGGMPPFFFASIRFVVAGVLILILLGGYKSLRRLTRKSLVEIGLGGIGMTGIQFAALFWSEQYITSGTAALIVATLPLFTTITSYVAERQKFNWRVAGSLFLGFAGVLLIVNLGNGVTNHNLILGYWGIWALLIAEFIHAIALIRFRKHTKDIPSTTSNSLQMLAGGLFLLILTVIFEKATPLGYPLKSYMALLYLISFGSVISYSIFFWLVKITNPVFPTTWTYVAPVIALAVGAIFLNEQVTFAQMIGAAGILTSVVVINLDLWKSLRWNSYKSTKKMSV